MTWKLSDIAQAVGGELVHAPKESVGITQINTDSRELTEGAIFMPLVAERNGHDFIESAVKAGAVASFWSEDLVDAPADLPLVVVEDTEKAYRRFAKWHLKQVNPKVVGITGSNGKTTTKDMTHAVLSTKYNTHKTPANENNQLGVPKTILSMPASTDVLILEMGMNAPGEIVELTEIGEPDVAVITMIDDSHIQAFGSREKIAAEKLSILEGLKADGLFIYPKDERLISGQFSSDIRHKTFGRTNKADLSAYHVKASARETRFTVEQPASETIHLPIPGEYNVQNALISLLIGFEFGVDLADAKEGLENLSLTKNRLEWVRGKNGLDLLNDAYNASPTSMKAAVEYFEAIDIAGEKGLVLGDILELGEDSKGFHESISEGVHLDAYKFVYLYGEEMQHLYDKLLTDDDSDKVKHFSGSKDALIDAIEKNANVEDAVLFKSSNGTDLIAVVDALKEEN